jgi:hypothetical protein
VHRSALTSSTFAFEEALRGMRADRYGASREKLGETPGLYV